MLRCVGGQHTRRPTPFARGGESSGKLAAYRINAYTGELQRFATYESGQRLWWVMAVRVAGK